MQSKLITYGIIVLIALSLIGSIKYGLYQRSEVQRLSQNQTTLLTNKPNEALLLRVDELKKVVQSDSILKNKLKNDLKISERKIESIVKSSSSTKFEIKTELRDSIIRVHDSIRIERTFAWRDKYTQITGIINDSIDLKYNSIDTLYLINYWKREGKFLPCIFGKKVFRMSLTGQNPNNKYVIQKNIQIVKD